MFPALFWGNLPARSWRGKGCSRLNEAGEQAQMSVRPAADMAAIGQHPPRKIITEDCGIAVNIEVGVEKQTGDDDRRKGFDPVIRICKTAPVTFQAIELNCDAGDHHLLL